MNRRMNKLMKAASHLRDIDSNDVLAHMGLARRRSTLERVLSVLGIFGAGIVVGAAAGLLASPVAPADVRKKIGQGVRTVKKEINEFRVARRLVAHRQERPPRGQERR